LYNQVSYSKSSNLWCYHNLLYLVTRIRPLFYLINKYLCNQHVLATAFRV